MIQFKQLVDPKNPAAGAFLQRVFLSHQDYNKPVIFETDGYHAESSMTKSKQTELTKRYQANRVVVEHRYSGTSKPSPRDWKYLTSENAAADLHTVYKALSTLYTGSWIATGISKGGINTMSYMMYYPNDMSAAVAYVAPICNGVSDTRFITHLQNVGTPEMRQRLVDYQRQMLIRREEIQPIFYPETLTRSNERLSADQKYDKMIISLANKIWQWGRPINEIPNKDASNQEMIDYLNSSTKASTDLFDMLLYDEDWQEFNPTKAKEIKDAHYFVQAIMELGYFSYNTEPLEDLLSDDSWTQNYLARFVVPNDAAEIQYSDKWNRQINQWLKNSDPRLICIYGEYDLWSAAAVDKAYFTGKTHMAIFIEKAGSHLARIKRLSPTDKQQVWAKLDSWVVK